MLYDLFGGNTTLPQLNWQAEPQTRGSWNILSSCILTLGLCLWTALHLNIPQYRSEGKQKWRKLGWLLVGLIAPEMVVVTAFEQRRAAYRLTKDMQNILSEPADAVWWKRINWSRKRTVCTEKGHAAAIAPDEHSTKARRHRWTHIHSFYALMGGLVFDASDAGPNFLPNGRSRLTLRYKGVIYVARYAPFLLPDIAIEEICDKSKSNGFAKSIICLQAAWFCTQLIVRVAQRCSVSLLELNTFAHAICALLLYALWWHKPLDIESPTLIAGEEAWQLCALMCVNSNGETFPALFISQLLSATRVSLHPEHKWETEFTRGQKFGDRISLKWRDYYNNRQVPRLRQYESQPRMILRWDPAPRGRDDRVAAQPARKSRESWDVRKGNSVFGFRCLDVYALPDWYRAQIQRSATFAGGWALNLIERRHQRKVNSTSASRTWCEEAEHCCTMDAADLRRWHLVSDAWLKYLPFQQESTYEIWNTVCDHSPNLQLSFADNGKDAYSLQHKFFKFLVIFAAGLFYGGVHILAWHIPFPTRTEQLLWRISSVFIASSGLCMIGYEVGLWLLGNWKSRLMHGTVPILCLLVNLAMIAYWTARAFLVVESCLQLSRLPPSAYVLPRWSQYFPHIVG